MLDGSIYYLKQWETLGNFLVICFFLGTIEEARNTWCMTPYSSGILGVYSSLLSNSFLLYGKGCWLEERGEDWESLLCDMLVWSTLKSLQTSKRQGRKILRILPREWLVRWKMVCRQQMKAKLWRSDGWAETEEMDLKKLESWWSSGADKLEVRGRLKNDG